MAGAPDTAAEPGRARQRGAMASGGAAPMVVGIAVASTSVESLVQLLGDLPARAGLSYVVLLQDGVRPRLRARLSQLAHLTVVVATDGVALRGNHLYIVTAGRSAGLRDGRLYCGSLKARGRSVVDGFLRSLAEDCGARAIGVVLAGCGRQGELGCRDVRMAGGLTLAQRLDDERAGARHAPETDRDAFEFCVAAREMAPLLLRYADTVPRPPALRRELCAQLLSALPDGSRAGFAIYAPALLARRVMYRMRLLGLGRWRAYCQRLGDDPHETQALRQDLERRSGRLLADVGALSASARYLVSSFVARGGEHRPLRVWVPGCGSGEEAYSIAMLLDEAFTALGLKSRVLIFATSADAEAIAIARRGVFPHTIAADLGARRLRRHFVRSGQHAYRIKDDLRASLVFSVHKLFVDPPFSQMDLIVGRTLLASLAVATRIKALALFQFALCASSHLLLGSHARLRGVGERFLGVRGQAGLWQRLDGGAHDIALAAAIDARTVAPDVRSRNALFERYPPAAMAPAAWDDDTAPRPQLLDALRSTRQDLRTAGGELRQSREVLQTSTEEMLSVNEELRATNEELVNTEEQLRAANLALSASNQALAAKIEQLEHINDDINNLIASTDIATLMLDLALRIQRYTPAIQQVLPVLPADVGRPLGDFAAAFDIAELIADCQQVIESQAERSREFELATISAPHTQASAWYVWRVLPYRTHGQRQVGLVVTFSDVSMRKHRELALARSHQDLANLLAVIDQSVSAIGDAVVVSDLYGSYLRFNDAAQQLFGEETQELPPHQWSERLEFYQPDMQTRVAPDDLPLARAMAGRFLAPTEFFVRTPRRSEACWCVAMAAPVHDGDGNYAAVSVFRDITEGKRAELQLRSSEGRLRAILDTMQDAVVTTDLNGRITSINRAAEQIFGYAQVDLLGSHLGRLLAATSPDAGEADLPQRFSPGDADMTVTSRKLTALRKSGAAFPVNLSVGASASRDMFTAVLRDMSAEQALHRLVIEAAEGEQRRIGQVLHDEVQQQLSSLGFVAGALLEALPAGASTALDLARRLEAGLSSTIGDIQGLARGLVPAEVETHGLHDALLHLVRKTAEESGLSCHLDYDDALQVGNQAVANQLFRIVAEGVGNAVKHSGADVINIALHAHGDELVMTIDDDGAGIAPDTDFAASAGMRIMRYRAETLGGQVAVGRSAMGGVSLTYTGPVR